MTLVAEMPEGHGFSTAIAEAALFRYSGMRLLR
jgi:hypothetical protein